MGFMQDQSLDISEIVTKISTEPSPILLVDDDDIEGVSEQKRKVTLESREKKFIMSPADIEVHQKVELQDAKITEVQQNAFKELCNEFKDIFSIDSSDTGKTPLLEMEIDNGDNLPITQKTLYSSFETCNMGTERIRNSGEGWSNGEKCLTLG